MAENITYAGVGVNYDSMDPFKKMAQNSASKTAQNINRFGFSEVSASRGESAYLIETKDSYLAHVEEGLGSKNIVADEMYKLTGKSYYDNIAQDALAMIVNDLITLGALPVSVAMHLAAGDSAWFDDQVRAQDLVDGWKKACDLSRCVWGGGETPTLKDIVNPETVVIAGSALGIIKPKERLIKGDLTDGDRIILLESSGIHANGLTLARSIAKNLDKGYLSELNDGRTYGDALLDPTIIYVGVLEDCLNANIDIHYTSNITGHGWRKLMRSPKKFIYHIETIMPVHPVFEFIQKHGPMDDYEAYGNLNMGAGFALFVPASDAEQVINIASKNNIKAINAGYIESKDNCKKVIIKPKNLEYNEETLKVR